MALSEEQRGQLLDLLNLDEIGREKFLRVADSTDLTHVTEDEAARIYSVLRHADKLMVQLAILGIIFRDSGRSTQAEDMFDFLKGMWHSLLPVQSEPSLARLNEMQFDVLLTEATALVKKAKLMKIDPLNNSDLGTFKEQKGKRRRTLSATNKLLSSLSKSADPLPTSNTFEVLASMDTSPPATEETAAPAPPKVRVDRIMPIYINIDQNWTEFLKHLNENIVSTQVKAKMNGELLKVHPQSIEDYRKIISFLREKSVKFHALAPQSERPVKILIRGLPVHQPVQGIMDELTSLGFQPKTCVHLKNKTKRTPTPPLLGKPYMYSRLGENF